MDVARNFVFAVLRVQHADFFDRDVEHRRNLVEMHAMVHVDSIGSDRAYCQRTTQIVICVVGHHIVGGNECRHISPRFGRQVEIDVPKILIFPSGTA